MPAADREPADVFKMIKCFGYFQRNLISEVDSLIVNNSANQIACDSKAVVIDSKDTRSGLEAEKGMILVPWAYIM